MASIQHTVELLDKTTAFDDLERGYWKELLPSMTAKQLGQFTQILEGHETRMAAADAKARKIRGLKRHVRQGRAILKALRPGATTMFLTERLYA